MEIFLNATFDRSVQGFTLLHVDDDGVSEIIARDQVPDAVWSFLCEDVFYSIWYDISLDETILFPTPTASFFGYRDITGCYKGGVHGQLSLAVYADMLEIVQMSKIVNGALCHNGDFKSWIFESIGFDETGNYATDKKTLLSALTSFPWVEFPAFVRNRNYEYNLQSDLIHYAAVTCPGSATPFRSLGVIGRWIERQFMDKNAFYSKLR